jgi:ATP-dependent DNA helicase PIF1
LLVKKQPLSLNHEFKEILDLLEYSQGHFFITGKAGTGKSTLLQVFRNTTQKRVAVLAPTGIAALNVRGQTIHSFFGFPPRMMDASEIHVSKKKRLYQNIDTIIIDEVSMVRADVIDNIDLFLKKNRQNPLPFGGVQMVFFGDLFQLPPVVAQQFEKEYFQKFYSSPYFFSSKVIQSELELPMIELNQVFRQEERHFISMLDQIRTGDLDEYLMEDLNQRYIALPENRDYFITLCSTNATANAINMAEIKKLDGVRVSYQANVHGNFQLSNAPADQLITLCEGAQIMCVKNDPQKQYVNGTIAKVKELHQDRLIATTIENDSTVRSIEITEQTWEMIKYEHDPSEPRKIKSEVTGSFTQLPVKLAWAITIHKSQGKTFDRVIIDMGRGAFESGQSYVALSRCRTLGGVYLKKMIMPRDIIVDEKIVEYYQLKRRYG